MIIMQQLRRKIIVMRGDMAVETLSSKRTISNMGEPLLVSILDNSRTLSGCRRDDEFYARRN